MIHAYGAAWARLQADEPGYARSAADQAFADDLLVWLQFHQAMLMDEVIPYLLQYLKANPGAPELDEYQHLLVDEYQDLNRAEQDVLDLLGANGAVCVIGDDDQSIYSFRHAHPEGIRDWTTLHNPADDHAINECRRCPTTIVRMANALIARNAGRIPPRTMVELGANGPGEVMVRQYDTPEHEADAVASKIASLVATGVSPGEIIVLTQRKTFASPIYTKLRARNIPAKSYYAESELDTTEAQERFAILRLLLNNEDRVALRWLLGRGTADWRTKPYMRVVAHVAANGTSPWVTLNALAEGTLRLPYTSPLVERFKEIRAELASLETAPDLDHFIQLWLPASPKTALLAETVAKCKDGPAAPDELYDALYEAITHPEIPLEVGEVRIMSLHKSKGLSSPFVFIVGCVEGLLPAQPDTSRTPTEQVAKLQEDRRLFYVGITRVKAALPARAGFLALTYSRTMAAADAYSSQISPVSVAGNIARLQASRFLGEMAPHVPTAQFNTPL